MTSSSALLNIARLFIEVPFSVFIIIIIIICFVLFCFFFALFLFCF